METVLNVAQIVTTILLVASILIQQRGDGLGAAFGGSDSVVSVRRGPEKVIFRATIIFAALFFGLAIARMFIA